MTKNWKGEERRAHPRLAIAGAIEGVLDSAQEASVVDLSLSGALVEVPSALPSGSRCVLRMGDGESEFLTLAAEVVRSYVHGFDKDRAGHPSVRYRAAIRFVDLSDDEADKLKTFLASGVPG